MNTKDKCGHCGSLELHIEGMYSDSVYMLCDSCKTGYFSAMTPYSQNMLFIGVMPEMERT